MFEGLVSNGKNFDDIYTFRKHRWKEIKLIEKGFVLHNE